MNWHWISAWKRPHSNCRPLDKTGVKDGYAKPDKAEPMP